METKDVILELRAKNGLSQDELAEKVYVTRQAVSRWENGETVPNTETLKLSAKKLTAHSTRSTASGAIQMEIMFTKTLMNLLISS